MNWQTMENIENLETKAKVIALAKDMPEPYPYIRAWEKMLGRNAGYLELQLRLACKDDAPNDAIYGREEPQT